MTDPLTFAIALLIWSTVIYDFLRTTISLNGVGPLTSSVVRVLWKPGRFLTLTTEQRFGFTVRGLIGPAILSLLAGSWVVLHLTAYTLFYLSGPSLEVTATAEPANVVQTLAYAGAALSTLGASIVQPTNGWWDVLSMVAALNGMIVLTLSVSFLLNIIQWTIAARHWAVRYNAVTHHGGDAKGLGSELSEIGVTLTATPLMGVFVPKDSTMSFPHALLDLARSMEADGVLSWDAQPADHETASLRYGIGLIGRHIATRRYGTDFEAARQWASDFHLPPRREG